MATIDLGRIKFKWQGAWSSSTSYVVDDVVESGGNAYVCIAASTNNVPPNATYWELMAQKGTDTSVATTQGDIIYHNGTSLARLGAGTSGQFLKTQGTGANPVWGTVEGISVAQQFRLASDKAGGNTGGTVFSNYEESDTDYQAIGSAWSQTSGIFSCSQTGIYLCNWTVVVTGATAGDAFDSNVQISTDSGSSYNTRSRAWCHVTSSIGNSHVSTSFLFDVNNTSTFRLRFRESQDNELAASTNIKGGTNENYTQINFIRLGAT